MPEWKKTMEAILADSPAGRAAKVDPMIALPYE